MGITSAILKVKEHRKSEKSAELSFLVDSGAIYSLVPGKILDGLERESYKEMRFSLADGTDSKEGFAVLILNMKAKAALPRLSMEKKVMKHCLAQLLWNH